MKNLLYLLIFFSNWSFGQSTNQTETEIEQYAHSVDKLRAENKLVKISYPNMSACGGGVDGYYLNTNLVLIDAQYNAELGFSSKTIYVEQDRFLKIIYREHFAEWGKYEKKYPSDKFEFDPTKMTYSDTVYAIILSTPIAFQKTAGEKLIRNKVDTLLLDRLMSCGHQMTLQLQEVIEQVDSLKRIEEMPYNCADYVEINNRNALSIGCGDELYWNVVRLHTSVIELLIDKLDDSTTTSAVVPIFGYSYTVADIAYTALEELIHNIPTFDLLGVPFDTAGCGGCSYWQHLNAAYSNRQKFKAAVRVWYLTNKNNLVWIENDNFATCDCHGKHPNGGHYELQVENR